MYPEAINAIKAYNGLAARTAAEMSQINQKGFLKMHKNQQQVFEKYTNSMSDCVNLWAEFSDPQAYWSAHSQLASKALTDLSAWAGNCRESAMEWISEASACLIKHADETKKFAWPEV